MKSLFKKKKPESEKKASQKALRILVSSTHDSLQEAVLADIVDFIPIAGDYANAMRVIDAAQKKEPTKLALQTGDLIVGSIPIIGDLFDLLTPTNTVVFVLRKKKLQQKLGKDYEI